MSSSRQHLSAYLCVVAMLILSTPAMGQVTTWSYDFKGYSAPSADMESLFGPKVAELDAKLDALLKSTDAKLPKPNPDYRIKS